jgi:hypothetical protein
VVGEVAIADALVLALGTFVAIEELTINQTTLTSSPRLKSGDSQSARRGDWDGIRVIDRALLDSHLAEPSRDNALPRKT